MHLRDAGRPELPLLAHVLLRPAARSTPLRGLVEHEWPYSDDEQVRARYEVMEYPVGIAYWAWGASWLTHVLNGSPDLAERYQQPAPRWPAATTCAARWSSSSG